MDQMRFMAKMLVLAAILIEIIIMFAAMGCSGSPTAPTEAKPTAPSCTPVTTPGMCYTEVVVGGGTIVVCNPPTTSVCPTAQ